jgi:o-succinylbenzoate synthase
MKFFHYKLTFHRPLLTSQSSFTEREGLLIYCDYLAFSCYGDVAPLPGYSKESLTDVIDQLVKYQNTLDRYFMQDKDYTDWKTFADSLNLYPSLRFGLDTFLFDRLSKKRGIPFNTHISAKKTRAMPVNTVFGLGDLPKTIEDCKQSWSEGYRTFKLKIGSDFQRELKIVEEIRNTLPSANIRLDANQAWQVNEAIQNLQKLSRLNIEYCEQPIKSENIKGLAEIKKITSVPIAADEAATNKEAVGKLIALDAVDVLVLKPMLIGSLDDIFQIVNEALEKDIETVFTTSLESGVGRLATAHLASIHGSSKYAHGLATGKYIKNDILDDSSCLKHGSYQLPDGRGIGLEPDMKLLEEIEFGVS